MVHDQRALVCAVLRAARLVQSSFHSLWAPGCMQASALVRRTWASAGARAGGVFRGAGEAWAAGLRKMELVGEREGALGEVYLDFDHRRGRLCSRGPSLALPLLCKQANLALLGREALQYVFIVVSRCQSARPAVCGPPGCGSGRAPNAAAGAQRQGARLGHRRQQHRRLAPRAMAGARGAQAGQIRARGALHAALRPRAAGRALAAAGGCAGGRPAGRAAEPGAGGDAVARDGPRAAHAALAHALPAPLGRGPRPPAPPGRSRGTGRPAAPNGACRAGKLQQGGSAHMSKSSAPCSALA